MNFMRPPLGSAADISRAIHKIQFYPLSQQVELATEINRKIAQLQSIGKVKNEQAVEFRMQLARFIQSKPAPKGARTWESKPRLSEAMPTMTPSEPAGLKTDEPVALTGSGLLVDNSSAASTTGVSTLPFLSAQVQDPPSSTTSAPVVQPKKASRK